MKRSENGAEEGKKGEEHGRGTGGGIETDNRDREGEREEEEERRTVLRRLKGRRSIRIEFARSRALEIDRSAVISGETKREGGKYIRARPSPGVWKPRSIVGRRSERGDLARDRSLIVVPATDATGRPFESQGGAAV